MDFMVNTAMAIEKETDDARSFRDAGASEKMKKDQPPSSLRNKQRTSIARGHSVQGHGYQGQSQGRDTSQAGPMLCFYCHQPGHKKWDCPQRWRSYGYRTPQSQTSMRHAPIEFVSSHPCMG